MSDAFRHNVIEIEAIDGTLRPTGDGWFDVEMGISVNGRTVRRNRCWQTSSVAMRAGCPASWMRSPAMRRST